MSSIRPLATIAVLAALGVFLAFKINEGPAVALHDDWAHPAGPDAGEPPAWDAGAASGGIEVAAAPGAPTAAAPAWSGAPASAPATPSALASAPAFPTLPSDPAKPSVAATRPLAPRATTPSLTLPKEAPSTAPVAAQSPVVAHSSVEASIPNLPPITGSVPSLGTATPAAGAGSVAAAAPGSPAGFEVAWEAVQAALARDELTRAHRMLSQWRAEPGLSPQRRAEVESLLGQLAGTVVYSTDHRLEPPHVVAPGETLASISAAYNVPWELLAKINGVAAADAVTPGQSLKVVRGPFAAEVDLARGELVLLLDERYAGKFPVRVVGTGPGDGAWLVGEKRLEASPSPAPGSLPPTAVAPAMVPKVVLQNGAGARVELSAATAAPAPAAAGLAVASNDLADLYDILSVGSPVTIKR